MNEGNEKVDVDNKELKDENKQAVSKEESTLETRCPSCNASIKFNPKLSKFKCDYCGGEFTLDDLKKESTSEKENVDEYNGYVSYKCESCGAEIIADEETSATFCVYCGNTAILKSKLSGKFSPSRIIPFTTTIDDAKEAFKRLKEGRPLVPNDFTGIENIEKIKGIYIPFWLYDLEISGDANFIGTRVKSWTTGDRHYTQTDTYKIARGGSMKFYDIPIDGSTRFDNSVMNSIEPFNYDGLINYNHAYLSGFYAEKYDTEGEELYEEVKERAAKTAEDTLKDSVIGYTTVTKKDSSFNSNLIDREYALLPVWMLNVKYKNKMYLFAMNGQTGKFIGDIPIDAKKTILYTLLVFGIGIILAIILSCMFYYIIGG